MVQLWWLGWVENPKNWIVKKRQGDPKDAQKICTSVYLDIVFGEKPHWKMQKHWFYQNTLDFPKLPIKNNG